MAAVTSLMRAQQVLLARLNDLLRPYGLTFPRYEALMLLSFTRTGALPLGKIGERLQVHRTSVTNIIDKLEADGLVRRVPTPRTAARRWPRSPRRAAPPREAATEVLNAESFGIAALPPRDLERLTTILHGPEPRRGRLHPVASRRTDTRTSDYFDSDGSQTPEHADHRGAMARGLRPEPERDAPSRP